MIIHQPELVQQNDHTILFSEIELQKPCDDFPQHLWFRVPHAYARYISLQSDVFLIPGLLAAMHLGENVEVRGAVSPRLAYQLDEYQSLLRFRLPMVLNRVDIRYADLKPLQAAPTAVGSTFSGGVDSFYTLWKHIPENQPIKDYRITHALYLLGFDLLNKDREKYEAFYRRYRDMLQGIHVELISLETNLVSALLPGMERLRFVAPPLISAAHVLGNLFRTFFIPSCRDYDQLKRWNGASDPTADPLLSSETLRVIHHGSALQRVEKIEAISNWELAQRNLRVCSYIRKDDGTLNCSRCEKCVRTMIPIYVLGKMKNFTTFTKPFMTNRDCLWWARRFNPYLGYVEQTYTFTRKHKPDLLPWLWMAAIAGSIRFWFLKLIPRRVKKWLNRFGYFVDPMREKGAFDNPAIQALLRADEKQSAP